MCIHKKNEEVANRFGRCFHRKREKFKLEDLKPGDHIVEERLYTFWHHMIVEIVELDKPQKIEVIHYYDGTTISSGSGSKICQTYFEYTPDKFYRVVYNENECLPACEVLRRAQERIGEKTPRYCPVSNNCEHFASECKTGKKECHQKWTLIEIVGKSTAATLGSLLKPLNYTKMDEKKKSLPLIETILEKILSKAKVKELMEKYREIFNSKYAMCIGLLVEVLLLYLDYRRANFSEEQFRKVMIKRMCAAICSFPGFWLGYFLGGMLPVAICGWAFPAVLVAIIEGAVGDFFTKVAGGILGDQVVLPLVEWLMSEAKTIKME